MQRAPGGGRKRKPNELLVLSGSRKARKGVARISPEVAVPECPAELCKVGRGEWSRVAPLLFSLRLITHLDMAALACYCQAWADLCWALRDIKANGRSFVTDKGFESARPAVGIENKAMEKIRAFCSEFGLTPSSRSRMEMQLPEVPNADNGSEGLLD